LKFVAASAPPSWWGLFVEAPDAASAIEEAIRRYDIRQPWQRERLVARQMR
jgi:hypothetical protein